LNWVLDKLTKPEILSDGTIRQPNVIMLKAADLIKQITELWNQDKNGRLLAEAKNAENDTQLETAYKYCDSLTLEISEAKRGYPAAIAQYKQAMNEDYVANCT
jgi:hypothetical protein